MIQCGVWYSPHQ